MLSIRLFAFGAGQGSCSGGRRGVKVNFELADVYTWQYPEAAFDVVVEISRSLAPRVNAN